MLRIAETPSGMLNAIGLQNPGISAFIRKYPPVWESWAVPAIVNISAETVEDFEMMARRLDDVPGVAALEVNISCPNISAGGFCFGWDAAMSAEVTRAVRRATTLPMIVKLSPGALDVVEIAQAVEAEGADAVSLINTINSIMRVDYDTLTMYPSTDGMGTHGGYCGEAVKPIALNMVAEIARTAETHGLPISGIGGVTVWRDAVDFLALGASNVQVCTAAMVYGFRIIDDLTDGLSRFLDEKGMNSVAELVGKAVPSVTDWQYLNLNYVEKAVIDQDLCIQCGRCHVVCEDTSHQAITKTVNGRRHFEVIDAECVGCNLCVSVCPVDGCITMHRLTEGTDPRTGQAIDDHKADWTSHPNNPMRR